MIDLHCHILPGIDDGPAAIDGSLKMAEQAVAAGIRAVVATPHVDNGIYLSSAADIADRVGFFNSHLAQAAIPLQVLPGAEVRLGPGLARRLRDGLGAALNSSRYLLLELPPVLLPGPCRSEIFNLRNSGFIPVIAHPERHAFLQKNPEYLAELVQMGCLSQVTAGSLAGLFGRPAKTAAETMLTSGLVHVLASDAHDPDSRGPDLVPGLEAAARLLGSRRLAERLVAGVPAAVIADRDIAADAPPAPEEGFGRPARQKSAGSFFSAISALWN